MVSCPPAAQVPQDDVPPESIFLLVSTAVAVLLGAGAVVAALRGRSDQTAIQTVAGDSADQGQADKYGVDRADLERRGRGSYGTAVRVLWWVCIAAVLIGVGLSDAYDANQAAIYALGADRGGRRRRPPRPAAGPPSHAWPWSPSRWCWPSP